MEDVQSIISIILYTNIILFLHSRQLQARISKLLQGKVHSMLEPIWHEVNTVRCEPLLQQVWSIKIHGWVKFVLWCVFLPFRRVGAGVKPHGIVTKKQLSNHLISKRSCSTSFTSSTILFVRCFFNFFHRNSEIQCQKYQVGRFCTWFGVR